MRTVNISASGAASLLVQAGDGPNLIVNTDANNTLWLGDTTATAANNLPEVMPLGPGGSVGVSGDNDVYAIADPSTGKGTIQTVVIAGGLNYFLGLTQGFGKLVVNSIQSPNYVPGVSGWIIRKDGSAEFNSVSIPTGSGGTVVFFAAPTPSAIHTGDVWYDITNGLLAHVATAPGTGSWVAQQISSPAIAPQGIQPSNIAQLTASLVGTLGVLNANPYFLGGDSTGWGAGGGGAAVFSVTNAAPAGSGFTYAGKLVDPIGTSYTNMTEYNQPFNISPNTQYQVTAWVYSTSGFIDIGLNWQNGASFVSSSNAFFTVPANTWVQVQAVFTSPASGAAQGSPYIDAGGAIGFGYTLYATACLVLPQVPGGLIQAGTITASQIAAGTITAAQLAAGIIYAGIINGTTVNAATFTGSKFVGTNWIQEAAGTFGYSGTPALGNLIFSDAALATAAATTTDDFGNTVYSGRCVYSPSGGATPNFVAQLFNGQLNISTPAGITHAGTTTPANFSGGAPGIGQVFSGTADAADTAAQLDINSSHQDSAGLPVARLIGTVLALDVTADPTTGSPYLFANSQGTPKGKTLKGVSGTLDITQTDSTLRSNATTTPTQISGAFTIPANDAVANTCYRLRVYGTGATGTTAQLFSLTLDGMGATGQASTGWTAAALPASTTFEYWAEAIIMVNTAGATGSARMFLSGGVSANGRPTTGQAINFGAANTSVTVDTTTLSQMLIKAAPGSITGTPSINGHASTFERLGP